MITIINTSQNITNLKNEIKNYKDIKEFKNIESIASDYRNYRDQELLIYNNRNILYSCSINQYKNKKYITHIYNNKRELVYRYNIDYSL